MSEVTVGTSSGLAFVVAAALTTETTQDNEGQISQFYSCMDIAERDLENGSDLTLPKVDLQTLRIEPQKFFDSSAFCSVSAAVSAAVLNGDREITPNSANKSNFCLKPLHICLDEPRKPLTGLSFTSLLLSLQFHW
jgi:hypothetical protein